MDKASQIDKCILRFTTERWRKVAMVAADVMFETDPDMSEVNDFEVAARLLLAAPIDPVVPLRIDGYPSAPDDCYDLVV